MLQERFMMTGAKVFRFMTEFRFLDVLRGGDIFSAIGTVSSRFTGILGDNCIKRL